MILRILFKLLLVYQVLLALSPFLFPILVGRFIGARAERSLEGKHGRGSARDELALRKVAGIFPRRPMFTRMEFRLLRGSELNAVALSNGTIYVWEGLYQLTKEYPEQLEGVLAHELGHLQSDHFLQRMRFSFVLQAALGWLVGGWASRLVARALFRLLSSGYSRGQEREADMCAVEILERAGRSAEGLAVLLEKLDNLGGGIASRPSLLGSHPNGRERAAAIRNRIQRRGLPAG